MARPRMPQPPVHLVSARMLDIVSGEIVTPGDLLVAGDRITGVSPTRVPHDAVEIDLGDVTMLPGLMGMEVNLVVGGPNHASPLIPVQEDRAATRVTAELIDVPGEPLSDITVTESVGFVMKGGQVYRHDKSA